VMSFCAALVVRLSSRCSFAAVFSSLVLNRIMKMVHVTVR
jgi:hypothetical protein